MCPGVDSVVPADTSPAAWRTHMRAMAAMTPQQRLALWEELNTELADMEERAVRRQHPAFSDHEVQVELVRRRYGAALAEAAWPTAAAP